MAEFLEPPQPTRYTQTGKPPFPKKAAMFLALAALTAAISYRYGGLFARRSGVGNMLGASTASVENQEVVETARQFARLQITALAAGSFAPAAKLDFKPDASIPYEFVVLDRDETGQPLDPARRAGLAINPRPATSNSWSYLLLLEPHSFQFFQAPYLSLGKRVTAWPAQNELAHFTGIDLGVDAPAAPAAPPQDPGVFPGSERLRPIVDQINAEGRPFGIAVTAAELRPLFDQTVTALRESRFELTLAELGLGEDPGEALDDQELSDKSPYKCLYPDNSWRKLYELPKDGAGFDCRRRLAGEIVMREAEHDPDLDPRLIPDTPPTPVQTASWQPLIWSARLHLWSPLSDEDHAQAVQQMLALKYEATQDADLARHADAMEKAKSKLKLARERGGVGLPEAEKAMRAALLEPYQRQVKAEAARQVAAELTAK